MKCAANIRNFFGKFAAHCKFLVLLGEICSVLQISFCKTDNTFCNLYIREFVFIWFYCPKHPIVFIAETFYSMRIYKPMLWLSY